MPSDATTFTLAFAAVFGILAVYLFRIDAHLRGLEGRLEALGPRSTKDINVPASESSEE